MTKIEEGIKPDDFDAGSIWREFVEKFGPAPLLHLIRIAECDKIYIPNYERVTSKSRKRLHSGKQ